jgi:hypothetical protein
MIAIVNTTGHPFGVNTYELRINRRVIATFKHKREDGLAICLQKAAAAAERAKWEEFAAMFEGL